MRRSGIERFMLAATVVMCFLLAGCSTHVGTPVATALPTATKPAAPITKNILSQLTPQMQLILSDPKALTKTDEAQRESYIDNIYGEFKRISKFSDSVSLTLGIHTKIDDLPTLNGPGVLPGVSMSGGEAGYGVLVKIQATTGNFESALAFPVTTDKYGKWELVHITRQRSAYVGEFSQSVSGSTAHGGLADYSTVLDTDNGHVVQFQILINPNQASGINPNSDEIASNKELIAYLANPAQYLKAHNNQIPPFVLSSADLNNAKILTTLSNLPSIEFRVLTAYI